MAGFKVLFRKVPALLAMVMPTDIIMQTLVITIQGYEVEGTESAHS
jgi:hypothetical protein